MADLRDLAIYAVMFLPAILVSLPIQLWLCFKAKRIIVKLIPTVLFAAAFAVFICLKSNSTDWDALTYGIMAVFIGVQLVFDLLAWAIWAVKLVIAKKKANENLQL